MIVVNFSIPLRLIPNWAWNERWLERTYLPRWRPNEYNSRREQPFRRAMQTKVIELIHDVVRKTPQDSTQTERNISPVQRTNRQEEKP